MGKAQVSKTEMRRLLWAKLWEIKFIEECLKLTLFRLANGCSKNIVAELIVIQWNPGSTVCQRSVKIVLLNRNIVIPGIRLYR